jgi:mandelamide amidase
MFRKVLLLSTLSLPLGAASGVGSAATDPELLGLGVNEAAQRIRSGELSSERLLKALLRRIDANSQLNAFISLDGDRALEAARKADARVAEGVALPPLHGVPLVLKDNIDAAGMPTTGGTPALRGHQPAGNAPVVQSLVDAGAIVLGKTNMHELAFGITSENFAFGAVRNPYNALTFPGGSSGGTAAAVAAGMAPGGLGTDTGGSVRIPSSLTGIAGLRPTVGRYSREGIVPISSTRDTAGPMARSVRDLVLLDGVLSGDTAEVAPAALDGLRLGVPRGYFFDNLDSGTNAAISAALKRLEEAGVVLVEADLEGIGKLNERVGFPVALYEVLRTLPEYLTASSASASLQDVVQGVASPDVAGALGAAIGDDLEVGTEDDAISENAYRQAMDVYRPQLQQLYRDYFRKQRVEAVVFPTTPLPARLIEGSVQTVRLNGVDVPTFPTYIRNTDPGSNAGIPGLSLPCGLTPEGLPVGLELDGPEGSDRRLLAIALALEDVFGGVPAPVLAGGAQ